jgi:hypothetical protein
MTSPRLACPAILAAATLRFLGACTGPVIIADGTTGTGANHGSSGTGANYGTSSGSGGSNSTGSSGTGATTSSSGTGGGGDACTAAGGTCEPLTIPGLCFGGTAGDPAMYPCGSAAFCCLPNPCQAAGGTCGPLTPGFCLGGTVGDASTYSCGMTVDVECCLPKQQCVDACTTLGATRCTGDAIETCQQDGACRSWLVTTPCPFGQACNSDGSKCIAPPSKCSTPADCGCGCTCTAQDVCGECTGALPPTCVQDSDCGPTCAGARCVGGTCQLATCVPGSDQGCNDNPGMNAFAGTCNPDRTCTCKSPFTLKPSGKCG